MRHDISESTSTGNRWKRVDRDPPPQSSEVEFAEGGKLWRHKPQKSVHSSNLPVDPVAEAARIDAKQEQQFEIHVMDVMKARYLAEFDNN